MEHTVDSTIPKCGATLACFSPLANISSTWCFFSKSRTFTIFLVGNTIPLGGEGGGGGGSAGGMGGGWAGGSIVHTKNAVAFKDALMTEPGGSELSSSQHGFSTKAESSVTTRFEYKCRNGTAPTLGISHIFSAHPWGADCTVLFEQEDGCVMCDVSALPINPSLWALSSFRESNGSRSRVQHVILYTHTHTHTHTHMHSSHLAPIKKRLVFPEIQEMTSTSGPDSKAGLSVSFHTHDPLPPFLPAQDLINCSQQMCGNLRPYSCMHHCSPFTSITHNQPFLFHRYSSFILLLLILFTPPTRLLLENSLN